MVIPSWFHLMTTSEVQALEEHIARIESQCDVEIVPVIVRASSTYPQTKMTLALVITTLYLALWDFLDIELFWDHSFLALAFFASYVVSIFIIAPWASRWGRMQMIMAHKDVEAEQCLKRAEAEFHSGKISQTKRQNGILIYVSLLEHRVIIKGDEAVFKKIEAEKWQQAVNAVLAGIKKRSMAQGIGDALNVMEGLLKVHFPVNSAKANEIPNSFIIKE